jgi:hypothetical protein
MSTRNTPIIFLSNQIFSGAGNVGQLSTSVGRIFSTQQSLITTSSLNINGGTITLSNAATADLYRYGATFSNSGLKIVSDQLAQVSIVNPSGGVAEFLFDTTAAGGPFTAIGGNIAPRGAFFFVNGDAININQTNQAVTLGSGGIATAQSNFKLLVNGNSAFTSSITLSNGDFSMSNVRTQKADLISTGINMYNGNLLLSTTGAVAGTATFNKTNFFLNAGNFTHSNTAAVPGTANFFNTALTVTGAQTIFNSTVTINGGALLLSNIVNVPGITTSATFYSTNMNIFNGNFLQSNVNSVTSYATFYSTAMTVHGSISTTGTLLCLGRFNTPNVGNVSTLIVGNNIASTAKVSLDINGSLRTSVQKFINVSGNINVNGGNFVYGSNASGTIILTIPETDGAEVGMQFSIHTDIAGGGAAVHLSTSGGDYINTVGSNIYVISKASALTSLFCYETGSWHAVTTG